MNLSFIVLNIIISPSPPSRPVISLIVLVLSLFSRYCVVPSIVAGISRVIASIVVCMVYWNGMIIASRVYVIALV